MLIDRDGVEDHFNMPKKERRQFPINDLLHGKRTLPSCGTQRVLPRGQESAVLPSAGLYSVHRDSGFDVKIPSCFYSDVS